MGDSRLLLRAVGQRSVRDRFMDSLRSGRGML